MKKCVLYYPSKITKTHADLAHLVERNLAKVEVAGSSPVIRSSNKMKGEKNSPFFLFSKMAFDGVQHTQSVFFRQAISSTQGRARLFTKKSDHTLLR